MEPFLFKDTFGGYLFGASIISVLLAFHVYRDRYPLFSAISLLSFAAGLLFSSHWLLIRSPGDSLDRVLTKPIGVVLLLASFAVLAWGYRRLRALPDRRPRPEREGTTGIRGRQSAGNSDPQLGGLPVTVWVVTLLTTGAFFVLTVHGAISDGVWRTRKLNCEIPANDQCTVALILITAVVGLCAGLLVHFALRSLVRWRRARKRERAV